MSDTPHLPEAVDIEFKSLDVDCTLEVDDIKSALSQKWLQFFKDAWEGAYSAEWATALSDWRAVWEAEWARLLGVPNRSLHRARAACVHVPLPWARQSAETAPACPDRLLPLITRGLADGDLQDSPYRVLDLLWNENGTDRSMTDQVRQLPVLLARSDKMAWPRHNCGASTAGLGRQRRPGSHICDAPTPTISPPCTFVCLLV